MTIVLRSCVCVWLGLAASIFLISGCGDLGGWTPPVDDTDGGTMDESMSSTDPVEGSTGMAENEGDGVDGGSTGTDGGSSGGPGLEATGEELFAAYCASCHGPGGVGTPIAYELQHPVRDYASWVVRNGRPGDEFPNNAMAAFGVEALTDDELHRIWDYLDEPPQPSTAQELYLDYCRNCHGENAAGGVTGIDLRDKDLDEILYQVRDGEDAPYSDRTAYMPFWLPSELTDAEVEQIADYIATL